MSEMEPSLFDEVTAHVRQKGNSWLRRYELWMRTKTPFRRLVAYLHDRLNRVQYDPVNPNNRTIDNPEGYETAAERELANNIERDKNLLDKVETYFRLRPVSTSLLAFFVIAAAAAGAKNNPLKIVVAVTIITAIMPLLLSRQDDLK